MKRQTVFGSLRAGFALGSLLALPLLPFSNRSPRAAFPTVEQLERRVTLADVPRTGPVVTGSAAIHEHVMAEHAFSGKWHWGSVEGPENIALKLCDGDGRTHAGAYGICSIATYLAEKDAMGRDTCCHSGGAGDCNFKATNGNDPDLGDEKWDYLDWPVWDTQAHPRYWHGHLRKALQKKLKLMVVHAVENYLLCSLVKKETTKGHPLRHGGYFCDPGDSFNSIKRQITSLKTFVANHSDFMAIAYSPKEAREIINGGRMAVVIGVEADYAWGNERSRIDLFKRLNDYHDLGARSIFLAHQVNTRLAGAALYQKVLWAQQSFSNCFFLDKQCADPDAQVPSDNGHNFEVRQSSTCCPARGACYARDYREMCAATLSRGREKRLPPFDLKWDGFREYPGGGVRTFHEENYKNVRVPVRKNLLGLTEEGAGIVGAMMKKGMLVEIGHLSEEAVADVHAISQQSLNYPLIASHGYARRMLFDKPEKTIVAGKEYADASHEFALGDATIEKIRTTEGILGHFIAPDPVPDYGGSKVINNCPRSTRSLAQLIAYAVDRGVKVAWAGDFMGFGAGVAPRLGFSNNRFDWCGGDKDLQEAQINERGRKMDANLALAPSTERDAVYFGTRGFAHFGLLKELHDDLKAIGLPERILNEFQDHAAENFIRTWEKSEFIAQRLTKN